MPIGSTTPSPMHWKTVKARVPVARRKLDLAGTGMTSDVLGYVSVRQFTETGVLLDL
jgi:hypothetical protein